MTIREAMLSSARTPVLGLLFLVITGQMAVAIAAFRDGRSRRFRAALTAFFLPGALAFWLCMSVISWEHNHPGWSREPPAWLGAVCACPVGVIWGLAAGLAVILFFTLRNTLHYRHHHVTTDSVKEAMDLLPMGIAFGGPDGTVRFRNLVMNRLSMALTGKLCTDWKAFQAAAGGKPVSAEGRAWQIDVRTTPGSALTQITATDITEQAGILADLEEKNRKLKDIHLRLEIYNRQAERIVIAQELLTARMAVHDELGGVLLESRHCLSAPSSIDEELLLRALKNANTYLLREYEEDDSAADPLAEVMSLAQAIGVRTELTGIPPAEEKPRRILAAAIRECATNAVKHAEGDRLTVDTRISGAGYTFTLCTNGKPPAAPIREAGGLLSLRTLVENRHGVMRVDADPGFCLTIRLPAPGAATEARPLRPEIT